MSATTTTPSTNGHAVVPKSSPLGLLTVLADAHKRLAEATDFTDIKMIRDQAAAFTRLLHQQRHGLVAMNAAAELKLCAERKLGGILADTVDHGGGHRARLSQTIRPDGVSKYQSSRWQMIASIPDRDFQQHLAQVKGRDEELTTSAVLHLARTLDIRARHHRRRQEAFDFARDHPDAGGILTGDMSVLEDHLEDDSVALFLCDLPYDQASLPLYDRLADLAARKLKPGGFVAVYVGRLYLDRIMAKMSARLAYFWLVAIRFHSRGPSLVRRRVWQCWACVLIYQRQPPATPPPTWFADLLDGAGRQKDLHEHQQHELEAAALIETFSSPGDLVVDPAAGCGTVLAAAKSSGRRWLGAELDAGTARAARRRLADTIPVS
jgi:hypothetical protein